MFICWSPGFYPFAYPSVKCQNFQNHLSLVHVCLVCLSWQGCPDVQRWANLKISRCILLREWDPPLCFLLRELERLETCCEQDVVWTCRIRRCRLILTHNHAVYCGFTSYIQRVPDEAHFHSLLYMPKPLGTPEIARYLAVLNRCHITSGNRRTIGLKYNT
jgi:hypothetical protein